MNNFGTLYLYELKKICMRKIAWITMGILIILTLFMGIIVPVTDSHSLTIGQDNVTMDGLEYIAYEKENAESLSGQKIDDVLLQGVKEAYQRLHTVSAEERQQYKEIYSYVYDIMGNYEALDTINEEILYQTRLTNIQNNWIRQGLSEAEKEYWLEKEKTVETPFVYGYAKGWEIILEEFLTLNFMLMLAIAVCLSNVFSDEHLRKTDQLVLCSKNGKKTLFPAKIAAGVTFGMACGIILLLLVIISTLCIYGTEGFDVAVQVYLSRCSWNISMGQAVMMMSAVYIAASIFCSIITMFLSEAIQNGVAVMGIMTGSMIVTMLISIPYRFRVISQVYELLPTELLKVWQLWDNRLVNFLGTYFTNFQIAPFLYLLISAILVLRGNYLYKNFQVSGR